MLTRELTRSSMAEDGRTRSRLSKAEMVKEMRFILNAEAEPNAIKQGRNGQGNEVYIQMLTRRLTRSSKAEKVRNLKERIRKTSRVFLNISGVPKSEIKIRLDGRMRSTKQGRKAKNLD